MCSLYLLPIRRETASALKAQKLPPRDRAGAVADAFSLANAGQISTDVALGLAKALKHDPDNLVRHVLVTCLVELLQLYSEVREGEGGVGHWRTTFSYLCGRAGRSILLATTSFVRPAEFEEILRQGNLSGVSNSTNIEDTF